MFQEVVYLGLHSYLIADLIKEGKKEERRRGREGARKNKGKIHKLNCMEKGTRKKSETNFHVAREAILSFMDHHQKMISLVS